jgi:hypothetical protein
MSDQPANQSGDQAAAVDQQKVIGNQNAAPQTKIDKQQTQAVADYSHVEEGNRLSMRVKVHSPFRNYYDDQAFSITAENTTGTFDVLPKHHNFISLLSPCELVIRSVAYGEKRIRISGGIMHVKADHVVVFLDV